MITRSLQSFVGKPVSVFVEPTARQVPESRAAVYFAGVVKSIDDLGVLLHHPVTGAFNFFFSKYIIGICEEELLDPNNPEDAKKIEEFTKKPQPAAPQPRPKPVPPPVEQPKPPADESVFVDIKAINELAKRAKEGMKK